MHTSPSVYVRYRLTSEPAAIDAALAGREVSTIIWTTTPWTLPASMAVAFHPDFEYVALPRPASADRRGHQPGLHCAAELAPARSSRPASSAQRRELARFKGTGWSASPSSIRSSSAAFLACWRLTSPRIPAQARSTPLPRTARTTSTPGSVTVLTRPAAWMPPAAFMSIPQRGRLRAPPPFEGMKVWAANPIIVAMLEERGALLAVCRLEHSYPHCWRCHHPVIFRATEQWFIGLEHPVKRADGSETTFRQLAIEEIDKVVWDPAWGKERITNMIATRPDWCISRQRIWGVPIAVFLCEGCNKPIIDAALIARSSICSSARAPKRGTPRDLPTLLPAGHEVRALRRQRVPQGDRHSGRVVRLGHELVCGLRIRPGPEGPPTSPSRTEKGDAGDPVPRRRRSASRLVPLFPADVGRAARPRALLARGDCRMDAR